MRKPRITFISGMTGYPWGGSEELWCATALECLRRGYAVQVSVRKWPQRPERICELLENGADLIERQTGKGSVPGRFLAFLRSKYGGSKDRNPAWNRVITFRPDLVCVSHGGTVCGLDWMQRCMAAGIPYVSVAQANSENWWPSNRMLAPLRAAYSAAERCFFVSNGNRRLFGIQTGLELSHAEVVRNPFMVPWTADPAWPEDSGTRLACVGRLEPSAKGQDLLFQVLSMPKWRARGLSVSLYGHGPNEEALKALVKQLGLDEVVSFRGYEKDVTRIWQEHHALILPSRFEGLPLAIVEAMLCGRPCIVTDVAGNRELLEDGETGFIADAPTVKHLDEAMERAWQMRGQWRRMGGDAAAAVRREVPQDPIRAFADKLLGISLKQPS